MSTVTKLLAQREQLLQRLQHQRVQQERNETEHLLLKIDTALHFLEGRPAESRG